jgi:hypothetical protein
LHCRLEGTHALVAPPPVRGKQTKPCGHSWPVPQYLAQYEAPSSIWTHAPPGQSPGVLHVRQKGKVPFALKHCANVASHSSQVRQTGVAWQVRTSPRTGPSQTRVVVLQRWSMGQPALLVQPLMQR